MVTRPVFGQSDQVITLTAILSKGAVTKTKIFSLTVLAEPPTDEQAVEIASNDLQIDLRGQATNAVISNIGLTNLGAHGVGISWSSSNADFIATNGMVTRPFNQSNAQVTLTATLYKGAVTNAKSFDLTVTARLFGWSELTTGSSIWSARYDHAALVLNGKIWVLGGGDHQLNRYNDVWWSADGRSWTNANASNHWAARWRHATVVFDDKMWVLGGYDGAFKNDVWWSRDGTIWTNANASDHWSGRSDHTAVVFDDKMWVLGGYDGSLKNDVWWSRDGTIWTNANASNTGLLEKVILRWCLITKCGSWEVPMEIGNSMMCGGAGMARVGRTQTPVDTGLLESPLLRWCLMTKCGSWAVMMVAEEMMCGGAGMAPAGQN